MQGDESFGGNKKESKALEGTDISWVPVSLSSTGGQFWLLPAVAAEAVLLEIWANWGWGTHVIREWIIPVFMQKLFSIQSCVGAVQGTEPECPFCINVYLDQSIGR